VGRMKDETPKRPSNEELKAENERLAVQFKAQHGLVVAFFVLILCVS
jgi:GPI ethanolamine phosphate transferase 3 subunit O